MSDREVFRLTIATRNAAFHNDVNGFTAGEQLAWILRRLADKLEETEYDAGTLADINGGTVGSFSWLSEGES